MITNFETNKVYFAGGLSSPPYADAAHSLASALQDTHVHWEQIPCAHAPEHIWVRDYMPVQASRDRFIKFRYEPDYLKDDPEYKPDVDCILGQLGIDVCCSPINLDGGNIISCGDKVILTDKIFKENPQYRPIRLMEELTELLQADPILIPWDIYEEYGHADGMVRYMGDGRVLLNHYSDFDRPLRKRLLDALRPYFDVEELHYGCHTANSWAYLNFLHVGKDIFIPQLNERPDTTAFDQIEAAFPICQCHMVPGCEKIVKDGGALNCSTWNVLADLPKEEDAKEMNKFKP